MAHRSVFFGGGAGPGEQAASVQMERKLTPEEVRVLGCLIEKERLTPDNYPLTLNSLVSACNQKSSRWPVVSYGDREVIEALDGLRDLGLSVRVSSSEGRVARYRHVADAALALRDHETAALGILLLRGPQTVGEVRQRGERMYPFASLGEAQEALNRLVERGAGPLATLLGKRAGEKEARYAHTIGLVEEVAVDPVSAAPAAPADPALAERVATLEAQVAELRAQMDKLKTLLD